MIKNDLDKALETANKTPSTNDVVTKIYGKKSHSVTDPVKSYNVTKPIKKHKTKKRATVNIPDGFPKDTIVNNDGTLTLPDGRLVRKISEVKDEQIQTA